MEMLISEVLGVIFRTYPLPPTVYRGPISSEVFLQPVQYGGIPAVNIHLNRVLTKLPKRTHMQLSSPKKYKCLQK